MIVDKINNIELEFSGSKSMSNNCNSSKCIYMPKSEYATSSTINLSDIMMNDIFNNDVNCSVKNTEPIKKEVDVIDIDDIIKEKEEVESKIVFDLKKEIINNDNESVVSSSNIQLTKKKLQKLNIDKLKEKCVELALSTDGTKSQLIDRIFEEINKDV